MKKLSKEEEYILIHKGTEAPFTGIYNDFFEQGIYVCKACGAKLYKSEDKFPAHCGWAAFDDEYEGAILKQKDKDGIRTEIMCKKCGGHLGHVFYGEGFTPKNTRHCVNSLSLDFIKDQARVY